MLRVYSSQTLILAFFLASSSITNCVASSTTTTTSGMTQQVDSWSQIQQSPPLMQQYLTQGYDLNACLVNCSAHGTCLVTSQPTSFTCSCFADYSGTACEHSLDPCAAFPCL